ncbi:MAG: hypothetical protein OEW47_10890 [Thermoleophilia bacterium]|nr:hypothetical protein [Thermoleophilia bacterium]
MRSRPRQLLALGGVLLAVAFGVAVAITLSGEDATASKADYQTTVVDARDRIDFAFARIAKSDSIDELIARIDEAAAVVDKTAGQLDDAAVAKGFEDDNDRLVRTLHAFSDELAGTAEQFEDPSFASALESITSLGFAGWENVNKALAAMNKKGLEVELLERH